MLGGEVSSFPEVGIEVVQLKRRSFGLDDRLPRIETDRPRAPAFEKNPVEVVVPVLGFFVPEEVGNERDAVEAGRDELKGAGQLRKSRKGSRFDGPRPIA